ncbi:MAG: hypothetical protein ABJA78_07225 [Ferruginibacter sp.]
MKQFFNTLFMIILYVSVQSQPAVNSIKQLTEARPAKPLPTGILHAENWYSAASSYIREQEYSIEWKNTLQQYVAVNRKNQVGFFFRQDGYRILSFSGNEKDNWEFDFRLQRISRGSNELDLTSAALLAAPKKLTYRYPQFEMEYLNDSTGMRQNFIVRQKPTGNGPLEITMGLSGQLSTTMDKANRLLLSSGSKEKPVTKMIYDGLKVWDKNNQPLVANMELSIDGKTLILKVDDSGAEYPITIDPLNHTPDWTDNGQGVLPSLDVLYGSSVSDAGDVNNDGFDDIIIGAPGNIDILSSTVIASVGQAFIYLGSPTGPATSPSITLQSSTTINGLFGYCVSSAGDINNDGYDDVIVGAPADQVTLNFGIPFGAISNKIGTAYIYYGNATTASIASSAVSIHLTAGDFSPSTFGLTLDPLYGFSVSSAGDVNNDGYADVIVGSPLYTDLGTLTVAGRATIYLGSSSGLNTSSPIHRNTGLLSNSLFGFSVSSAGDMNNDGADEVLIGAPGSLTLVPGLTGKVYVYQGISVPTPGAVSATAVTYSDAALLKTLFGYSVSNAGDVNNDGFDDIIVGEPLTLNLAGLVSVGRANIFYGSATLSNKSSADVVLRSPRDPDILGLLDGNLLFGFSVSGGKDLDCDGIDDVIVGEPGGTAIGGLSGVNAAGGQAYIYYGKNTTGPSAIRGWEQKETGSIVVANLLGSSVSVAGDVNADGSNDILIGAANGTLDLSNILGGIINYTFVQSIGSAYVNFGCLLPTVFTLPVNLINFSGYLNNNEVVLKWQTSSEQNYSHFEVERSANGSSFEKIGLVTANNNSNTLLNYSFIDVNPVSGTNAYRLKNVDKDGKFTYSSVINIKLKSSVPAIRAKATAGSNEIAIEFINTKPGRYTIDLLAMNGSFLQRTSVMVSANNSIENIALLKAVSSGMYIVKVQGLTAADQYHDRLFIK